MIVIFDNWLIVVGIKYRLHLQVALQTSPPMSPYCKFLSRLLVFFFSLHINHITDNLNELNVYIMYFLGLGITYSNSKMFFIRTIKSFQEKQGLELDAENKLKMAAAYKKSFHIAGYWKCLNIDRSHKLFGVDAKNLLWRMVCVVHRNNVCLDVVFGLCCLPAIIIKHEMNWKKGKRMVFSVLTLLLFILRTFSLVSQLWRKWLQQLM